MKEPPPASSSASHSAPPFPRTPFHNRTAIAAGVAALAAAVFANALTHELVWDDPIVLTRQLQVFRTVGDVIFPPRDIPQFSPDYYRPLTIVSYLVDRAIAGSAPWMFHLSVIVFHVTATVLVFRLGLALFRDSTSELSAGIGAALFAVHPIHTESVAWGAGRSDVLACVFGIAAALAYLHGGWSQAWRSRSAAALLFAALLAKETAAPLLLLIPASDLILGRRAPAEPSTASRADRRRQRQQPRSQPSTRLVAYLPFVLVIALYVLLRGAALGTLAGDAQPFGAGALVTVLGAIAFYLGMLLLPVHQSAYVSDVPTHPAALAVVVLALLGAFGAGIVAWRRGARSVVWLTLWIALTLVPSLAIVLKIPAAPVAERYLYLPSAGFCLLTGYGAGQLLRAAASRPTRALAGTGVALILVTAAFATVRRSEIWRSNLALWTDTAWKNTTDGLPARSLATAYLKQGDAEQAAAYFRLALQRRNDRVGLLVIHNNLGSLAMQQKDLDEAERQYRTALEVEPRSADALFNLGLIALTRATQAPSAGDSPATLRHAAEASSRFERALQLNPHDADTHIALGQTLTLLAEPAAARQHYEQALRLGVPPPTEAAVRHLLAELE